jgi:hypothetical protein
MDTLGATKRCPVRWPSGVCNNPIVKPRRGPTGTTCSASCRQELYRQRHPEMVFLFLGDDRLEKMRAPKVRRHDPDHEEVIEAVKDNIANLITFADDDPERVAALQERIVDTLGPFMASLRRGRRARQDDVFKIAPRLAALWDEFEAKP